MGAKNDYVSCKSLNTVIENRVTIPSALIWKEDQINEQLKKNSLSSVCCFSLLSTHFSVVTEFPQIYICIYILVEQYPPAQVQPIRVTL